MLKWVLCGFVCNVLVLSCQGETLSSTELKKTSSSCGTEFKKATGSINLVNHTKLPDGSCTWYIEPELKNGTVKTIKLLFESVFIHETDTVSLYSTENNITNLIWGPIHTQNGSLTVITEKTNVSIVIEGNNTNFYRNLDVIYVTNENTISISNRNIRILHSPICTKDVSSNDCECEYIWNYDPHYRSKPAFTVDFYNLSLSTLELASTTADGKYTKTPPIDFFPATAVKAGDKMLITATMQNSEYFRLRMHYVDTVCSGFMKARSATDIVPITSPPEVLDNGNGSITTECRWIIQQPEESMILGLQIDDGVHFDHVFDIVAVNDGGSELSLPLLQMTTSNLNSSKTQFVRTTKNYMWIAFKPRTFASKFLAKVTSHARGGYFKESTNSSISMTPTSDGDTVFLLEVAQGKAVYLNFSDSSFPYPATLSVYDGFDKSDLLATLHGDVWYPVISRSSKMMLIANNFNTGKFSATFKGITNGCLHMSSFSNENYVLSGNCNDTCIWVIPPQDHPGSDLLLHIQFLSLNKNDQVSIFRLDRNHTRLGDFSTATNHVPQMVLPAQEGALVEVTRAPCEKTNQDVAVVGHSSYIPACSQNMTLSENQIFQLTSPLHPDTYPAFSKCAWKLTAGKGNLIHLALDSLSLAAGHCIKINNVSISENKMVGDFLLNETASVEFDATNCAQPKEPPASLRTSSGFVINGTVAVCGGVIENDQGTISVPSKDRCIWMVKVKESADNAEDVVNIISFEVTKKDEYNGNDELLVYDGDSVREKLITNRTGEMWSRTNTLIFEYRRLTASKPASTYDIKYKTIGCNSTMQCDNKLCMHPDWRCNGEDDCGDFSDERNCQAVPVPPKVDSTGYSAAAFWVSIVAMACLGVALGVLIHYSYLRYKSGYRRFGDISIIE